jgi:hypothetical protein
MCVRYTEHRWWKLIKLNDLVVRQNFVERMELITLPSVNLEKIPE